MNIRLILAFTLSVAFPIIGTSQTGDSLNAIGKSVQDSYKKNPDSVRAMANIAVKVFTWDIKKVEKGTLMFLDVPYQRSDKDSMEYITLTVAKEKTKKRPDFISIIIPNNVVFSNGIFIKFANTITDNNGNRTIKMDDARPLRLPFEESSDPQKDYYSARIIDGYAMNDETDEQVDVFQNFLDYDHVVFLFIYPDGSHKSVAVPLFSFKSQYAQLN